MKQFLFASIVISIALYACSKTEETTPNPDPPVTPVNSDTTQSFSDSLRVYHYKSTTKGQLPDSAGNAIILVDQKDTIVAENGTYAVIVPKFKSGFANGFYLQVKGADSYFTIDFNQAMFRKVTPPGFEAKAAKDSVIVLQLPRLPENILPHMFTIEYTAYDSLGNISNVATSYLKIVTSGPPDNSAQFLQGKWHIQKYVATDLITGGTYVAPILYDPEIFYWYYSCVNNKLVENSNGPLKYLEYLKRTDEASYNFGADHQFHSHFTIYWKRIDLANSRCDSAAYTLSASSDKYHYGRYYYNAISKQLIIIYEEPGAGRNASGVEVYNVSTLTDHNLDIWFLSSQNITESVVLTR